MSYRDTNNNVLPRSNKDEEDEKRELVKAALAVAEEPARIVDGIGNISDQQKEANELIDKSGMSKIQRDQAKESVRNPEKLARDVGDTIDNPKTSIKNSFLESLAFFMPQAIGAGIGAIFEGGQGALAGAEIAGGLAKEKREYDLQVQNRQMTPYQQEQTRLREEQLKLDKEAETRRNKQLGLNFKKFDLTKQEKGQLSEKQTSDLAGLDNALASLDSIKALKPGVTTGPISGRIQAFGELFGAAPKAYTQLKTEAVSMANNYIKAITGAQMSEPEAKRIMSVIPTVNDTDEVFVTKMEVFEKIILRNKEAILKSIKSGQKLRGDIVEAMMKEIEPLEKFKSAVTAGKNRIPTDEDFEKMTNEELKAYYEGK